MILIEVRHKIEFSDRSTVLVGFLESVEVISGVSVLVDRTFSVSAVELIKSTLQVHEFLSDELFKIVSEEPEVLVLLVQLLHVLCELFEVSCNRGRVDSSQIVDFMQEMSDIGHNSSVLAIVRVRNCRPVKLQQAAILPFVNIPIIDPLNALELKPKQMLYGHLRMRMPEAISRPSNLRIDSKLSLEEVMPNGVLINDIIDIANRLIILHPTSIRHLQLPLFEQFFDLFLLILVEIVVPILEEYDLRNEVFAGCVLAQCLKHRVEYSLRVPLIHSVQKSSGSEVNILEIIVSIKPEGIEMRVEGDQELLTILRAFLADSQSKQGQ